MFEKIKRWYSAKLWTKEMVAKAVEKNQITEEEYEKITGESFN